MKHNDAVECIRRFAWTLQKYRSNAAEMGVGDDVLASINPWIFGDKCPLSALFLVLDRVNDGGEMTPMEYYNFLFVGHRFMSEVAVIGMGMRPLPEPDTKIIAKGWD